DALYLVEAGSVDILAADAEAPDGETLITTLDVGDEFGEMAFLDLDHGPRSATAVAGARCTLIRVPYASLREELRQRPQAAPDPPPPPRAPAARSPAGGPPPPPPGVSDHPKKPPPPPPAAPRRLARPPDPPPHRGRVAQRRHGVQSAATQVEAVLILQGERTRATPPEDGHLVAALVGPPVPVKSLWQRPRGSRPVGGGGAPQP